MDTRGQFSPNLAAVILLFVGGIVATGLAFIFLQQAWEPAIGIAESNASTSQAQTGINRYKEVWGYVLLLCAALLSLGAIASAASVWRRP